jgi:histidine triad (HIT) family protein
MDDCIFCKIIKKEIPAYIVWEDEKFISFLDRHPVNPGHILIIPKEHHDNVFALPADLYKELFENAKVLSTPLQEAMSSVRVGMVVEGFGMPHAHVHLVPINHAHELDSSRAMTMTPEEMSEIAEKIKAEIKK